MSLSSRLRTATSPKSRQGETLLIFETVRPVIESHALVQELGLDARDVHRALVAICHKEDSRGNATRVPPNCPECGLGYVVVDAREGQRVCDRCGIVVEQTLNVHPEFDLAQNAAPARSVEWSTLAHWNQFTGLTIEQLTQAATHVPARAGESYSGLCRIAAALLKPIIVIPDAECVRSRVGEKRTLESAILTTQNPTFECPTCGTRAFDAKTARYHCRNR